MILLIVLAAIAGYILQSMWDAVKLRRMFGLQCSLIRAMIIDHQLIFMGYKRKMRENQETVKEIIKKMNDQNKP